MAKDEFIRFRVAGWEKHYITKKAEKAHMSISEFVRSAAMDREVTVIEGMDELLTELRRQGNNLNQITRLAHQGRVTEVNLAELISLYRKILLALGGDNNGSR